MEQFLYSLLAGTIGAFLVSILDLRKFRSQQWWQLKAETYSKIVTALHNAERYYDAKADPSMPELLRVKIDRDGELAFDELRLATGIGPFTISDKAATVLETLSARNASLTKEQEQSTRRLEWRVLWGQQRDLYRGALQEFRELAKQDLKVTPDWFSADADRR